MQCSAVQRAAPHRGRRQQVAVVDGPGAGPRLVEAHHLGLPAAGIVGEAAELAPGAEPPATAPKGRRTSVARRHVNASAVSGAWDGAPVTAAAKAPQVIRSVQPPPQPPPLPPGPCCRCRRTLTHLLLMTNWTSPAAGAMAPAAASVSSTALPSWRGSSSWNTIAIVPPAAWLAPQEGGPAATTGMRTSAVKRVAAAVAAAAAWRQRRRCGVPLAGCRLAGSRHGFVGCGANLYGLSHTLLRGLEAGPAKLRLRRTGIAVASSGSLGELQQSIRPSADRSDCRGRRVRARKKVGEADSCRISVPRLPSDLHNPYTLATSPRRRPLSQAATCCPQAEAGAPFFLGNPPVHRMASARGGMQSAEERRRQRELEEARKAGLAPAEVRRLCRGQG